MEGGRNGVRFYTRARVELYFPEGQLGCRYCPLLETYARNQCRRTGEYIADTRGVGLLCPLEVEEQSEREKENGK